MFESNPVHQEIASKLFHCMASYPKGSVVSWLVLEETAGMSRDLAVFYALIRRARARLQKQLGVNTWPCVDIGIKLLLDSEVSMLVDKRQKRAYRQINRAIKAVKVVDKTKLTTFESMLLGQQYQRLCLERNELHRARKEGRQGFVLKPTQALPRNPLPGVGLVTK